MPLLHKKIYPRFLKKNYDRLDYDRFLTDWKDPDVMQLCPDCSLKNEDQV